MRAHSLRIALLGAAVAMVAIAAPAVRVDAATEPSCNATAGVTVIVDFAAFGHGIARGCASGRPATALAAMQAAGFETAGTTQYGDAFLCRIDGLPSPKSEACTATPPARSSWSFYWAHSTDKSWTYSRVGVLSYQPPAGTIIAFAFGDLAKPGVLPPAAIRVTTAAVTTTTPPPPTTPPTTTAPVATVAPVAVTTVPTVVAPTTAAPTVPPTTKARATTVPTSSSTTTTVAAAARIDDRVAVAKVPGPSDSGSPLPVLIGAALVVALGAGAAFAIRARRARTT